MDQTETINAKIAQKDGRAISLLFDTGGTSEPTLRSTNLDGINHPFNILLSQQAVLLDNKSYRNIKTLLGSAVDLIGEEQWTSPIIRRISYSLVELDGQREINDMDKFLPTMHKQLLQKGNTASLYIANIMLRNYVSTGRLEPAENLLLAIEGPEGKRRDLCVFHYYKGLVQGYKDRFKDSHLSLKKAFGHRRCRAVVAPVYFLSALLNNRFPRKRYLMEFGCGYMAELVDTTRHGIYTRMEDVVDRMSSESVDRYIRSAVMIHCPLVCFGNLVRRIYNICGHDNKLDIRHITDMLVHISFEEVVCLLNSLANSGRLKGYISVNRGVVVFSRTDPFPV